MQAHRRFESDPLRSFDASIAETPFLTGFFVGTTATQTKAMPIPDEEHPAQLAIELQSFTGIPIVPASRIRGQLEEQLHPGFQRQRLDRDQQPSMRLLLHHCQNAG